MFKLIQKFLEFKKDTISRIVHVGGKLTPQEPIETTERAYESL